MKRIMMMALAAMISLTAAYAQKYASYGVAFYNLENLFDTIPNNPLGRDLEFTPQGTYQWGTKKYQSKIENLATAISHFTSPTTPMGPAIIGVSEIENKASLDQKLTMSETEKEILKYEYDRQLLKSLLFDSLGTSANFSSRKLNRLLNAAIF